MIGQQAAGPLGRAGRGASDVDAETRRRIRASLDESLVVEAGAGTGKTTALVDRIEALVRSGQASIDRIAAITFTRAAAGELRERIRERFERLARDEALEGRSQGRIEGAVAGVEQAGIQTIDSFALSLLRERALEAGLPPLIKPIDEVEAALAFEERWRAWLDQELEDGDLSRLIPAVMRLGLDDPGDLKEIARAFHENYDLVRDINFTWDGAVARRAAQLVVDARDQLEHLLSLSVQGKSPVVANKLRIAISLAGRLERVGTTSDQALAILAASPQIATKRGSQEDWGRLPDGRLALASARDRLHQLQRAINEDLADARACAFAPVLNALRRFVLEYAGERRASGRPEFRDLLVWALDMVSGPNRTAVLKHFRGRFTHILIDEFQDTDPLQTELALRLTSDGAGRPVPGALFVVGDPKQSIYRFRRADMSSLERVKRTSSKAPAQLRNTRRTHTALVDWLNELFGGWMGRKGSRWQAPYEDLASERAPLAEGSRPMGAYYIGAGINVRNVGTVRRQEIAHIVEVAQSVGRHEWPVSDASGPSIGIRASTFRDLCILMPRRVLLTDLERALEEAGVPYSVEGQSLVFNTQEVIDLVNCMAAIDDPSDEVAVVAALRSPAYGCSDPELFEWARSGRRFDPLSGHSMEGPVGRALTSLRQLHMARQEMTAPELIERFIRERRLRELALGSHRAHDRWRLLQAVVEQARTLADAGRPSLRDLIHWANDRRDRQERVSQGGISDPDTDAVRIMTVHNAKGLEFPIVLLTGLNARRSGSNGPVLFEHSTGGRLAVRLSSGFSYGDPEAIAEIEKEAGAAEDIRVIYVAATRARDHLIVSLYRTANDNSSAAAEIARRMSTTASRWLEIPFDGGSQYGATGTAPSREADTGAQEGVEGRQRWIDEWESLIALGSRPRGVSATGLRQAAAGYRAREEPSAGDELMLDGAPLRRGRGGTPLGRAVHGVLQDIELRDCEGLADIARRHAEEEGIPESTGIIERLARAVAGTDLVQRAARGRHWKEVYVAMRLPNGAGGVLDGFVDLVFELPDGLLGVVDYKTDAVADPQSLEDLAAPYHLQVGAYAAAIESVTRKKVAEAWIVFARRAEAGSDAAYRVPNLESAMREAIEAAVQALVPEPSATA